MGQRLVGGAEVEVRTVDLADLWDMPTGLCPVGTGQRPVTTPAEHHTSRTPQNQTFEPHHLEDWCWARSELTLGEGKYRLHGRRVSITYYKSQITNYK